MEPQTRLSGSSGEWNYWTYVHVILDTTAGHYHLLPETLIAFGRIAKVSHARQMAMYAVRELVIGPDGLPLSFPKIGAVFTRDHTTVIHAWRLVRKSRNTTKRLEVDEFMRRVKAALSAAGLVVSVNIAVETQPLVCTCCPIHGHGPVQ